MFDPFHRFAECGRLERIVRRVIDAGTASQGAEDGFNRFHFSLVHKLRSAFWHVTTLRSYLEQSPPDRPFAETIYRANFHFDGFCYCVGSAKDIFAREILSYFGVQIPHNTYFNTARERLQAERPGDPILPRLADPNWRPEFRDYRNTATHECVVTNVGTIRIELRGDQEERQMTIPLPADPRDPNSGIGHDDVATYCEDTFRRTVSLINTAYRELGPRIRRSGQLPL